MPIVHRYIGAAIAKTFLFALVLLMFVFALGTTFKLMQEDLSLSQLVQVLPYAVLYTLPYLLPVSLIAALTLTYGRLVADREVLALRASGMTPWQIMLPGFAPGILLLVLGFALEGAVLPYLHWRIEEVTTRAIEEFLSLGEGSHKSIRIPGSGIDLYIRRFHSGELEDLTLRRNNEQTDVKLQASRGHLAVDKESQSLGLSLEDVRLTVYSKNELGILQEHTRVRVESFRQDHSLGGGKGVRLRDLSSAQLRKALNSYEAQRIELALHGGLVGSRARYAMPSQVHATLALRAVMPFSSLIAALVAVPLTLLLSSENRLTPFFLAFVLITLCYFIPFTITRSIAGKGSGPLWILWVGPATGFFTGLALCWKVSRT